MWNILYVKDILWAQQLFYKVEKGKLFEKIGRKVMGLRYFYAMTARLPTFFILEKHIYLEETLNN